MPRFPEIKVPALAALADDLKFVPPATARRCLLAAEGLQSVIEPDGAYPSDWITLRVTGYRPDLAEPDIVVGAALLAALPAFTERLSARAALGPDDVAGWPTADELARKWGVARRSVERWRREGLLARRFRTGTPAPAGGTARRPSGAARTGRGGPGRGAERLAFLPASVERFERLFAPRLAAAGGFSRIDDAEEARLLRRARAYARVGLSRFAAARKLAPRHGRSVEALRALFARHDASSPNPIFSDPAPLLPRDHRVIGRAFRRGLPVKAIADRFGRSVPAVHRLARVTLARSLLALLPPRDEPRAAPNPRVLEQSTVRLGLGTPVPRTVRDFVEAARAAGPTDPDLEFARASAAALLKDRAAALLRGLDRRTAPAAALDEAVTNLRWAALLRVELVRSEAPLLIATIEAHAGKPLDRLPPADQAALLRAALAALIAAADRFDPGKGGRLAAPAGLAMGRAVSRFFAEKAQGPGAAPRAERRAAPIDPHALAPLPDWSAGVAPWQKFTLPHPRVLLAAHAAGEEAELLRRRYGLGIAPPTTLAVLAQLTGTTPVALARRLRTLEGAIVRSVEPTAAAAPTGAPGA